MEAAWERIETWLAAHAPVTFDALAPPADPAAIAAAEQAIDPSFPEPLRRSLLRHDGTTGHRTLVLPNYRLLSAAEIADRWLTGIEDESPAPWWDENGAGDTENPDSGLGVAPAVDTLRRRLPRGLPGDRRAPDLPTARQDRRR